MLSLRIMAPALTDPQRVIASGGIVRVINGTTVGAHRAIRQVRLPRRLIEVLQVIEYLRAFLIGRQGWAQFDLLLIIFGAFGIFGETCAGKSEDSEHRRSARTWILSSACIATRARKEKLPR